MLRQACHYTYLVNASALPALRLENPKLFENYLIFLNKSLPKNITFQLRLHFSFLGNFTFLLSELHENGFDRNIIDFIITNRVFLFL